MKDDYDYMNDKWITRGYSNGYSDRRQYTGSFEHYDVETLETDEEKSARLLKEKAVKRNDKIDKLLENGGL